MKTYLKTLWRAIQNKPMIVAMSGDEVPVVEIIHVLDNSYIYCNVEVMVSDSYGLNITHTSGIKIAFTTYK